MTNDSMDSISNILNFKVDPENRIIYLMGEITEETLNWFLPSFSILDLDAKKPITIRLTSGGGDSYIGFAIYDLIRAAKNKVFVEVYGYAYSIAALILQAADVRLISPSAKVMIHDTTIMLTENASIRYKQMGAQADELRNLCDVYYEKIAERTKMDIAFIKKLGIDERILDADGALKYHFVDSIIKGKKK